MCSLMMLANDEASAVLEFIARAVEDQLRGEIVLQRAMPR